MPPLRSNAIPREECNAELLDSLDRDGRTLFYPSSCRYAREFQELPYDAVILNSHDFRRCEQIGKVWCLNCDNNQLVGMLHAKQISLAAVAVIRDGCVEGGNYECAARDGFFGRLMPILADDCDFFCDHAEFPIDAPARFAAFETPRFLGPLIGRSDPLGPVRAFHVTPTPAIECEFSLGEVRVRVIWDSIWRDLERSDLVVVKKRGGSRRAIENYLLGRLADKKAKTRFQFVQTRRLPSIANILQEACDRGLRRVSLIPLGGNYPRIASEIRSWNGEYPEEIDFYHLNANDFQHFRSPNCS